MLAAVWGCGSDTPTESPGPSGSAGAGGSAGAPSGAGGSAGSGGSSAGSRPADSSSASIASFLTAKMYESPTWVAETAMPRESGSGSGSPHERVRVYFNDVLVDSFAAGKGSLQANTPHSPGSMAVKVMYDGATQVGVAAELRLDGAFDQWTYYCEGPMNRCATGKGPFTAAAPYYGVALNVDCGFCHGGVVFTRPPN